MQNLCVYHCQTEEEFLKIASDLNKFDEFSNYKLSSIQANKNSPLLIPAFSEKATLAETQKAIRVAVNFFDKNFEYLRLSDLALLQKFGKVTRSEKETETLKKLVGIICKKEVETIVELQNSTIEKVEQKRRKMIEESEEHRSKKIKGNIDRTKQEMTELSTTAKKFSDHSSDIISAIKKFKKDIKKQTRLLSNEIEEEAYILSKSISDACKTLDKIDDETNLTSSFSEFLQEKGYMGIPKGLNESLYPLFAKFDVSYYTPLKKLMEERGITPPKGILLSGSPGTGKTFFARVLFEYLSEEIEVEMKELCATELISKYVGDTEASIREIFETGIDKPRQLTILFIDEFDAIAKERESSSRTHEVSQVNQFLSCMDGFKKRDNLLVIAATNNKHAIDKAILRPGRFDSIVDLDLPNKEERESLFELYLRPLKEKNILELEVTEERLATLTEGCSHAEIAGLVKTANKKAFLRACKDLDEKESQKKNNAQISLSDFEIK